MTSRSLAPLALLACPSLAAAGEVPTNVVIVLMDEVGTDFLSMYDDLNPYTADDPTTSNLYVESPRLDALAASGVMFTNAYAQPMCSPSRSALLTGCYATRTGVGDIFKWPAPTFVGAVTDFGDPGFECQTIADLLAADFATSIFGKWHLAMPTPDMDPVTGMDCYMGWASIPDRGGFEEWRCIFNGLDNEPLPPISGGYCPGFYNFYVNSTTDQSSVEHVVGTYATVDHFDEGLAWCTAQSEPFFCLITPNASHSPYQDLAPLDLVTTTEYEATGSFNTFTRYCASLEALDVKLGEFLDGLVAADLYDETLILVMGDNGTPEVILEHARRPLSAVTPSTACSSPIFILGSDKDLGTTYDYLLGSAGAYGDGRFKGTVYEKGTRVPLIVAGAGVDGSGRTNSALVQIEDVLPTVAEMLGLSTGTVDGISFADILGDAGEDATPLTHARDYVWSQRFRRTGHAAVSAEQELHEIGCSLRIPGEGRFKIVRDALANDDEFYQLEDASGADVDPYELIALDYTLPAYSAKYALVADKIDDVMLGASSGSSCVDPPAAVDCFPVDNSTNAPAIITTEGTTHIECNDLVFHVTGAVPNKFARFFYGQTSVPSVPAGDGNLCICTSGGCPTYRLELFETDDDGNATFALDHGSLPGAGTIESGETWYFQLWYRDPFGDLGTGFNFSNSLEVTFCD